MNCEDVCTLLGPFIDDELSVEVAARINAHIAECLECQDERAALTTLRSRVHDLRQELEPPQGFMERLRGSVEARRRTAKRVRGLWAPYMVPLAAAAATVLCLLPDHREEHTAVHRTSTVQATPLSAQEIYSYENELKQSSVQAVEYDPGLATQLVGFDPKPLEFHGWRLLKTRVVSINSTKAIKYSYGQMDHGKMRTVACYQFRRGAFDASNLSHHVIDGRNICCGTCGNVSLVYWNNAERDFLLASEMSRADLMDVALNS